METSKQHIYVIENQFGMTKIGITNNIQRRMNELRLAGGTKISGGWYSTPLKFASSFEKSLHIIFRDSRQDGEWFMGEGHENYVATAINDIAGPWQEFSIDNGYRISHIGAPVENTKESEAIKQQRIEEKRLRVIAHNYSLELNDRIHKLHLLNIKIDSKHRFTEDYFRRLKYKNLHFGLIAIALLILRFIFGESGELNFELLLIYAGFFSALYLPIFFIELAFNFKISKKKLNQIKNMNITGVSFTDLEHQYNFQVEEEDKMDLKRDMELSKIESKAVAANKQIDSLDSMIQY